MTYPAEHVSISIDKPVDEVYAFAGNPENLPEWVDFIESVTQQADSWLATTSLGELMLKFREKNDFGIIDHEVTLPDGQSVSNPIRVVANHQGSEVSFIVFRMPGRTEEEFQQDIAAVKADLEMLKRTLEQ